jgi:hypothetical protein
VGLFQEETSTCKWELKMKKPRRAGSPSPLLVNKKGAGFYPAPRVSREMRSSEKLKSEQTYLLSAMGLAPKSRRPLTAVRAARAAGMLAAAAP